MRDELLKIYPELSEANNKAFRDGTIILQDDTDGNGVYIAEWNYLKPIPAGYKLGK